MPHTNTVFRDILKLVPGLCSRSPRESTERRVGAQFHDKTSIAGAVVWPIVGGAGSLKSPISEASMTSHQGRLYHGGRLRAGAFDLRGRQPQPQPGGFYFFMICLGMTTRGLRRKLGDAVRLIDLHPPPAFWRGRHSLGASFPLTSAAPTTMILTRLSDLSHDHRGHGQRHHCRQGDADSRRRHLCLLDFGHDDRRWVAPGSGCRLPHRDAVQEKYAAPLGQIHACRACKGLQMTASASCRAVRLKPQTAHARRGTPRPLSDA